MTLDEFVAEFTRTRHHVFRLAAALPAERRDEVIAGEWSLRDVIAHMIGWDYTNVDAVAHFARGALPSFYAEYDPGWAGYNARLVQRYAVDDWQELLSGLWASQHAFIAALRDLPDDALDGENAPKWQGRRVTLRGVLKAALRDEAAHVSEIEAFVNRQVAPGEAKLDPS